MNSSNTNQRPAEDPDKDAQTVKVVLLGDSGVGKSSLALRFVTNEFKPYNEATIGASFMSKTVLVPSDIGTRKNNIGNTSEPVTASAADDADDADTTVAEEESTPAPPPKRIAFKIWDTAGQEKYASLAPMYYRGAGAAVLTYDICKSQSFDVLKKWVIQLQRNGPPNIVLAVCGNKFDLAPQYRQVDADVARQYAESIGATFYEVSAKEAINVQVVFHDLARRLPDLSRLNEDILLEENGGSYGGRVDIASLASPLQSNWIAYC